MLVYVYAKVELQFDDCVTSLSTAFSMLILDQFELPLESGLILYTVGLLKTGNHELPIVYLGPIARPGIYHFVSLNLHEFLCTFCESWKDVMEGCGVMMSFLVPVYVLIYVAFMLPFSASELAFSCCLCRKSGLIRLSQRFWGKHWHIESGHCYRFYVQ